ncbi:MAG: TSUP family transporter [Bradymonadia bacterium]
MSLPVDLWVLALGFVWTIFASAVQGTIGFGFAVVSVPVLSLVDPSLAPVPQLLVTMPLALSMVWRERHAIELSGVGWLLAGRIPGALVGLALLKLANARTLDVLIALVVMSAVVVMSTGRGIPRNRVTEFLTGVTSGAMALVSSIGGPPIALLYRNAPGATLRSSLAAVFSVGVLITLVTRGAAGEISRSDLVLGACLLPAMFLGLKVSNSLKGRVEGTPLRIGILVVASLAALGLLVRALTA